MAVYQEMQLLKAFPLDVPFHGDSHKLKTMASRELNIQYTLKKTLLNVSKSCLLSPHHTLNNDILQLFYARETQWILPIFIAVNYYTLIYNDN